MESLADWLQARMNRRGMNQSQMAAYLDTTPSTVNRWLQGKSVPNPESCRRLSDLFHEPLAKVYELAGHPSPDYVPEPRQALSLQERMLDLLNESPVAIPIHEQAASAGVGEEVVEYAYWEPERIAGRQIVGVKVKGDSMAPEILPGDTVFMDTTRGAQPGDIVVATIDDSMIIKRLMRKAGHMVLQGTNGAPAVSAEHAKIEGVVISFARDVS